MIDPQESERMMLKHFFEMASPQDWTEDFHLENGNYQNRCCACGSMFYGYKRRVICKVCDDKVCIFWSLRDKGVNND